VIAGASVLVLGLSFKENCPDLRNTRVVDVIAALQRYGIEPVLVDPWVDANEAKREYGLMVLASIPEGARYQAVIAAVAHHQFINLTEEKWSQILQSDGLVLDIKGIAPRSLNPIRL
jgi:UDP-N-acetyl-D-galactosamine dehydrogenase